MLRSMFSGLAGLSNSQTALDVVGNNIANVNTVGYKSSKIEFTELLNQTIRGASSPQESGRGGTNPIQVGLGVGTSAVAVSHQQGNLQSTGIMSDLAIQGNGFFVVGDGSTQTFYTRSGAFSFDGNGSLVYSSGLKVYGWMADPTGVIDKNSSINSISIPVGQTISANETTSVVYAYNLDSRANTIGTPVLSSGNSANVSIVSGKFDGSIYSPAIDDVRGTHSVDVYSETHNGTNTSLNGTTRLTDLDITNIDSFRIVVDSAEYTINLSNGLNSTVNEIVSAINAQIPGVTAILDNGAINLTRNVAGMNKHVHVYDSNSLDIDVFDNLVSVPNGALAGNVLSTGQVEDIWTYLVDNNFVSSNGEVIASDVVIAGIDLSNVNGVDFSDLDSVAQMLLTEGKSNHVSSVKGIAGSVFSNGNTEWLPGAKTLGTLNNLKLTDELTGLDNTNDFIITANDGSTYTFDLAAEGVLATSNIAELISAFNIWSKNEDVGLEGTKFYMGLTKDGKLFVTYEDANRNDTIEIADSTPVGTGLANTMFANSGDWVSEADSSKYFDKNSDVSYIQHIYSRADGGGSVNLDLEFDETDTRILGLNGLNISASDNGFKSGKFILQTVDATEHVTFTTVYDSLGKERIVTLTLKRENDNTWAWTASGTDVTGAGLLVFDNVGALQQGAISGTIAVGGQGGANPLTITPNFTLVTQFADASSMVHTGQDGYPNGSLETYSISSDGGIIGIYSNGLNQDIGQIAMASFNNPAGLLRGSDGMFMVSNNSGDPQIGSANSGGRGAISAGTLEMSNVDIAEEFANMIIYQRGFQANSKIITTGDELLQTLVQMKR
jgi:flagellar hook protein FlgE